MPGFVHKGAAYAVAMLDELSERLFDLIADLPQDALDYVPEGSTNSIAMLVIHMAWAEAGWIARVTQTAIPAELEQRLLPGRQDNSGDLPAFSAQVASDQLVGWCRRVRQEVTKPALTPVQDVDLEVGTGRRPMTVRGVLMHLVWHWTYHSGQVGLLRRLWGQRRYQWTFDHRIGGQRPS
jgi:uncharacterized damage-inducible protein DinB